MEATAEDSEEENAQKGIITMEATRNSIDRSQSNYCRLCDEVYRDKQEHLVSIGHLLHQHPDPKQQQIFLSADNKGFQLMQKQGWVPERPGLGKLGQGRVTPIKTRLKYDTAALGSKEYSKTKPRVTHFPTHRAVEELDTADGKSKAKRVYDQHAEKVKQARTKRSKPVHVNLKPVAKEESETLRQFKHDLRGVDDKYFHLLNDK